MILSSTLETDTLGSLRPLPHAGEPELGVQGSQPTSSSRRYGLDSIALALKSSAPNGVVGVSAKTWSTATADSCWHVRVEHPMLTSLAPPLAGEVDESLVEVVGDHVDVCGFSGPAHGHVAELSAASVGEHVRGVDRRSLHPVHRQRVGMIEVVAVELVSDEDLVAAVAEADGHLVGPDACHGPSLTRHEPPFAGGGEGHHEIARGVAPSTRCFDLRAGDGTGRDPTLTGTLIEGGDVAAAPSEKDGLPAGKKVAFPCLDRGFDGVLADRCCHW